jgi:uncharacterized protein
VPLRTFGQLKQLWQARTSDGPGGEPTDKPPETSPAETTTPPPPQPTPEASAPEPPKAEGQGEGEAQETS